MLLHCLRKFCEEGSGTGTTSLGLCWSHSLVMAETASVHMSSALVPPGPGLVPGQVLDGTPSSGQIGAELHLYGGLVGDGLRDAE